MQSLREYRTQEQNRKYEHAVQDWAEYRRVRIEQKSSWQQGFAARLDGPPLSHIEGFCRAKFSRGLQDLDPDLGILKEEILLCHPDTRHTAFSEDEVKQAVNAGKVRKAVGIDGVPQELLQKLVQTPTGLEGLTQFFNRVLWSSCLPEQWKVCILTLLAKTDCPCDASQLRPIALSSHVYKTFSRLIMQRMTASLYPSGPEQTACQGRQAAEFTMTLQLVSQLSLEWGCGLAMAKLDISRAFDAVDRRVLARKLFEKFHHSHPGEVYMLITMLESESHLITTQWGTVQYGVGSGVKQGAVESPWLFAWLVDLILQNVKSQIGDEDNWLTGAPVARTAYMDDVVGWSDSTAKLQVRISALQREMEGWGLQLNLSKSSLLCYGNVGVKHIVVGNQRLEALPENTPLEVMGVPIGPRVTGAEVVESLLERVRKALQSRWAMFHSNADVKHKLRLLDRVCFGSISWVIGSVFPTVAISKMLNQAQMELTISLCKWRKSDGESWVDYRQRAFRGARQILHRVGKERWSTMHLRLNWRLLGHVARNGQSPSAGCAGLLTCFRPLSWWRRQQGLSGGARHNRRHFPRLMLQQSDIASNVGSLEWLEVAKDRVLWASREGDWILLKDVPWASGTQFAIEG